METAVKVSSAWFSQQIHGETICSSCGSNKKSGVCSFISVQRSMFNHGSRGMVRKEMRRSVVKGCEWNSNTNGDVKINGSCGKFYDIAEENMRFV